jgi:transcriptional regulator with XRE-family HTH domain
MGKYFSKLRALREQRGLRQLDIVIATRLSPATVWAAEHGDSICKESRIKIAKALGVSPEDLWGTSHEQKISTQT